MVSKPFNSGSMSIGRRCVNGAATHNQVAVKGCEPEDIA